MLGNDSSKSQPHACRNLVSCHLLSKTIKLKLFRTTIFPVLYGSETWFLTLKKDIGLECSIRRY
jgi:hypothetical protein